jgi:hypothetical protein
MEHASKWALRSSAFTFFLLAKTAASPEACGFYAKRYVRGGHDFTGDGIADVLFAING